jgi:tRNA-2-methylthio-N6-dimethylallyladenosine synthase
MSFSFMFGPRPGAPAASLPDPTPADVKHERCLRCALLRKQGDAYSRAMVGSTQRILVTARLDVMPAVAGTDRNNRVVNRAAMR